MDTCHSSGLRYIAMETFGVGFAFACLRSCRDYFPKIKKEKKKRKKERQWRLNTTLHFYQNKRWSLDQNDS